MARRRSALSESGLSKESPDDSIICIDEGVKR
jgi:hypothetical protein